MLPMVEYEPDGSCTVVGWVYAGVPPLGAPGLGKPDNDGYVAVPIYDDDGSVIKTQEAPQESRDSVKAFEADRNYQLDPDLPTEDSP
jgi:hypothetical protein